LECLSDITANPEGCQFKITLEHIATIITQLRRQRKMAKARRGWVECNGGSVAVAMRLLVLLTGRAGKLVQMRWEDVDFNSAQ